MTDDLKQMSLRKLKNELKSIQNHIDNCGYGKFELYYREEILKEIDNKQDKKYPQELGDTDEDLKDFDMMPFGGMVSYEEEWNSAVDYARKSNGRVYTVINAEGNHVRYLKGFHRVNRLGFVVLVKK